ncbi:hypothetical protein PN498_05730 [Oscillatoria sp. CS-180]|uniref:hypothetical protein n=1 Tax=Oscillatoria sp. CS-180 TaxID=3021720 RepID=UPI00232AEEE6|nr:hypothetical protein [Oscillatoria sp. CS-180]MDB9525479.1 hypothetical protein [Oscillatoria sp. CS-180]
MLSWPFLLASAASPETPPPLLLAHPELPPERDRLRHLLIGSPRGVQSVIHRLHVLGYAEQAAWSPLLTIPKSGLLITPEQGEVLSLLRRDQQKPLP